MYIAAHSLHMTCILLSLLFFIARGFWMMTDSGLLQNKFVRIAPHVIDTVLLASALTLTVLIQQYPFTEHWLTAKLVALVVYIGLGTIAIKRGKTKAIRIAAFAGALVVFAYIISVAFSRNPLGFLG